MGIFPLGQTVEGLYDMTGNVWEWCLDWKDVPGDADKSLFYEQSDGSTNPLNDKTRKWGVVGKTGRRVFRGGAWATMSSGSCGAAVVAASSLLFAATALGFVLCVLRRS